MDKSELLPCPFCGSKNVETSYKDTFSGDFRRGVYCADCCGGIYPYYKTEAEAIKAWNKRVKRYPESLAQRMIADGYEYELFALRKECNKLKADLQAEKESNINTKLTVDQVRKCVLVVYYEGYNDGYLNRGSHYEETDWQAITDELNATRTLAG